MKPYYFLSGEINQTSVNNLTASMLARSAEDVLEYANLYISSTGGDLDSAIRFYDFIKASDVKINTVGYGQIDSAAVLLFLVGDKRILIKNCRIRLHLPVYNGPQSQVLSVHLETVSLFRQLDNRYFEIISSGLSKPVSKIKQLYSEGKILTPKDAMKLGIATEVADKLPIDRI